MGFLSRQKDMLRWPMVVLSMSVDYRVTVKVEFQKLVGGFEADGYSIFREVQVRCR